MGCTIDHLQIDHRVIVLRDFTDARGVGHRAGEIGCIRRMDLDWAKQEILIEWESAGKREVMAFLLAAREGPRNGAMREFFEIRERVNSSGAVAVVTPRPRRPGSAASSIPEIAEGLVVDESRHVDAMHRVWALAGRRRFAEAEEQLRAMSGVPDIATATALGEAAAAHAADADRTVYEWLRDRSINHWHAWGSQATSGGDGAARLIEIDAAIARFKKLDQR